MTSRMKIVLSMVVILIAVTATVGGTFAWFTDEAQTENTFTAGTLIIDAEDGWRTSESEHWDNANPGDCEPKDFIVTNSGSKNMYVRFKFEGAWEDKNNFPNPHDLDLTSFDPDNSLVEIKPNEDDLENWTKLGDYWYYNGILPPNTNNTISFTFYVCLDGPDTGNEYQGASFNITFTFDAIQATHTASFDNWFAGYYNDSEWYGVNESSGSYTMPENVPAGTWKPTGTSVPNYQGWEYSE